MPKAKKAATQRPRPYQLRARLVNAPAFQGELPVELLEKIVANVKDKSTLAACMRVSSTFNRVVAPVLYESIDVQHQDRKTHPFVIPFSRRYPARLTASKRENLKLVRTVTVRPHYGQTCANALGELPVRSRYVPKYTGTCLRLDFRELSDRDDSLPIAFHDPHVPELYVGLQCNMWRTFAGKMLVLLGAPPDDPFYRYPPLPSVVETLVAVVHVDTVVIDFHRFPLKKPLKNVVCVLSARDSNNNIDRKDWHIGWQRRTLAFRLVRAIQLNFAIGYTIVSNRPWAIEVDRQVVWAKLTQYGLESSKESIRFITTREYVSTQNWRDAFTEEEARFWLDEN